MGILSFLRGYDTDGGVREFIKTPDAVLLDVRTLEEYAGGHIPFAKNLPLDRISEISNVVPDRDTPVFVYCRSGSRSGTAEKILRNMGYSRVKNIGGMLSYGGKVER